MLILCCSIASWILTLIKYRKFNALIRMNFPFSGISNYTSNIQICIHLPVLIVHLVKLINKANSFISKNKGPSFKSPLPCDWVLVHCCREPHSRSSFSSSIHSPLPSLFNVPIKETLRSEITITKAIFKLLWNRSNIEVILTWEIVTWPSLDHLGEVHLCPLVICVSPQHFSLGLQT